MGCNGAQYESRVAKPTSKNVNVFERSLMIEPQHLSIDATPICFLLLVAALSLYNVLQRPLLHVLGLLVLLKY